MLALSADPVSEGIDTAALEDGERRRRLSQLEPAVPLLSGIDTDALEEAERARRVQANNEFIPLDDCIDTDALESAERLRRLKELSSTDQEIQDIAARHASALLADNLAEKEKVCF